MTYQVSKGTHATHGFDVACGHKPVGHALKGCEPESFPSTSHWRKYNGTRLQEYAWGRNHSLGPYVRVRVYVHRTKISTSLVAAPYGAQEWIVQVTAVLQQQYSGWTWRLVSMKKLEEGTTVTGEQGDRSAALPDPLFSAHVTHLPE